MTGREEPTSKAKKRGNRLSKDQEFLLIFRLAWLLGLLLLTVLLRLLL